MNTDDLAAHRAARIDDLEYLASTGETVPGAATRLRVRPCTLRAFLYANHRKDLFALLLANQDDRRVRRASTEGLPERLWGGSTARNCDPESARVIAEKARQRGEIVSVEWVNTSHPGPTG